MKQKLVVKIGTVLTTVLIAIVALMTFSIFALWPIAQNFTNALLTVMIAAQLCTVVILIYIYEKLEGKKK